MTVVERPQKALLGKLRVTSTLVVETGLHIGGGGETLEIGGVDKLVVRDPITQQPYLPGSSIKGKLRAILERLLNKPLNRVGNKIWRYESDDLVDGYTELGTEVYVAYEGAATCTVSRVFGSTGGSKCWIPSEIAREEELAPVNAPKTAIKGEEYTCIQGRNSPARLIVRDAHLLPESAQQLAKIDTGLYMTEWKFENGIDRITSAANPRQVERIPAGTKFRFEMVYTVEDEAQAIEDLNNLAIALAILEDDALGGHGSRGYGKVRFEQFRFYYRGVAQYRQVTAGTADFLQPIFEMADTAALLQQFGELTGAVRERLLPGGDA
ncbi:type III-A CRISPR-associated RAMP protein Csm3 [Synechococcus sp. PCC 7336]|uniref:type III-A CRISPR-associated RAMP protein Csm3 n=1 Tax=Synechococcus sp. PCC 7336 TaxID=195250 RepID=UPI00034996C2|nr:type III-A CRISPR-associated RAMP protein Csm3 [Synechococcus sp. PCC 7336]